MSAREASTIDSEKNEQTTVNGVLDDEKELARMGYKQELKCANTLSSSILMHVLEGLRTAVMAGAI